MIRNHLIRRTVLVGIFGTIACLGLGSGGNLLADDDDDRHGRGGEQKLPPQTLKSGFESTRDLLRDVERAERGPEYSAWIVESSRFLNVPHRAFTPDVGDPPTVDLPVNVGIIKGPDGKITLYDSRLEAARLHLRLEHLVLLGGHARADDGHRPGSRATSPRSWSATATGTMPAS